MEPNEMERYTFLSGFLSCLPILVEHPTGEWVRYSDAMQIITALQAKIDGMIKRPVVEVVKEMCHELQVNGKMVYVSSYNEELLHNMKSDLTTALGMDDSTNTKEPQ